MGTRTKKRVSKLDDKLGNVVYGTNSYLGNPLAKAVIEAVRNTLPPVMQGGSYEVWMSHLQREMNDGENAIWLRCLLLPQGEFSTTEKVHGVVKRVNSIPMPGFSCGLSQACNIDRTETLSWMFQEYESFDDGLKQELGGSLQFARTLEEQLQAVALKRSADYRKKLPEPGMYLNHVKLVTKLDTLTQTPQEVSKCVVRFIMRLCKVVNMEASYSLRSTVYNLSRKTTGDLRMLLSRMAYILREEV